MVEHAKGQEKKETNFFFFFFFANRVTNLRRPPMRQPFAATRRAAIHSQPHRRHGLQPEPRGPTPLRALSCPIRHRHGPTNAPGAWPCRRCKLSGKVLGDGLASTWDKHLPKPEKKKKGRPNHCAPKKKKRQMKHTTIICRNRNDDRKEWKHAGEAHSSGTVPWCMQACPSHFANCRQCADG